MKKNTSKMKKGDLEDALRPIDRSEGKPYQEEWTCGGTLSGKDDIELDILTWSAKPPDKGGGIIIALFPDNGEKPVVQVRANTPTVRDLLRRFTPAKQSAALKRFGALFVNGEPTEDFLDVTRVYSSLGDIPERLSKKIAEATATLDFLWLQGYAEVVRLLSEEMSDSMNTAEAREAWTALDGSFPKFVEFVKAIDWTVLSSVEKIKILSCLEKQSLSRLENLAVNSLFRRAMDETNGNPSQITVDHFKAALEKTRREIGLSLLLFPKVLDSFTPKVFKKNSVGNDDIVEIIRSLTEQLIGRGERRPPSKSEVLREVNMLLKARAPRENTDLKEREIDWPEWDLSRLNDPLESLGFFWLAHPREVKRKD